MPISQPSLRGVLTAVHPVSGTLVSWPGSTCKERSATDRSHVAETRYRSVPDRPPSDKSHGHVLRKMDVVVWDNCLCRLYADKQTLQTRPYSFTEQGAPHGTTLANLHSSQPSRTTLVYRLLEARGIVSTCVHPGGCVPQQGRPNFGRPGKPSRTPLTLEALVDPKAALSWLGGIMQPT